MLLEKGTVVMSTAGREKCKFLVVLGIEKDKVLLINGKNRSFSNPKLKNIKHIKKTNTVLNLDDYYTDKKIRKYLNNFVNKY